MEWSNYSTLHDLQKSRYSFIDERKIKGQTKKNPQDNFYYEIKPLKNVTFLLKQSFFIICSYLTYSSFIVVSGQTIRTNSGLKSSAICYQQLWEIVYMRFTCLKWIFVAQPHIWGGKFHMLSHNCYRNY